MPPFEDTWSEIESDPEYQALKASNPVAAGKLVRKFARKVAHQEVKGSDPRMAAFLGKNLPPVKGAPRGGVKAAAVEGVREGFDQSATGMLANAATGRQQHGGEGAWQAVKDATSNIASGANSPFSAGALTGLAGAAGSMVGQVPDLAIGGGLTAGAARGLAAVGVKSLPAAVAASVGVNAATGAAVTKATGGTNSDAAKNAAVMGLMGLAPFAGRVPAGRLNPTIGRQRPPAPAPAPQPIPPARPSGTPLQRAQDTKLVGDAARAILAKEYGNKPGTPQAIGLQAGRSAAAERLGAPPTARQPAIPADTLPPEALLPSLPRTARPQAEPFLDLPPGLAAAPARWREAGATLGRSAIDDALGAMPSPRPPQIPADVLTPEALLPTMPRGIQRPYEPALDAPPPMAPRQVPSPPAPRPAGPPHESMGAEDLAPWMRPGARPYEPFLDAPPPPPSRPITPTPLLALPEPGAIQARGEVPRRFDPEAQAARQWGKDLALYEQVGHEPGTTAGTTPPRDTFLQDASHEDLARWLAGYRSRLTAAKQNLTRLDNVVRADKQKRGGQSGIDETMMHEAHQDVQELPQRITELEAEITRRALRGEPFTEPTRRTRLPSTLKRLASDESGSMRLHGPAEAVAAGQAVRRAIGQGARMGAELAGRAGEPIRRGHEALTHVVGKGLDATGVSGTLHMLDYARRFAKSPDFLAGNVVATAARRAFISDYGVPPELLTMAREANRQARREVQPIKGQAIMLNEALSPEAQARLDREITEPGTPRSQAAEDAASESARLSQLLEEVGALSPEARARWEGHYLPRVYRDKFPVISGLVKTAARTLKGHKARGTEKQMSPAAYEAERDAWEFRGYTGPGADKLARAEAAMEALQAERASAPTEKHAALDRKIEAATERQLDALATPGLKVRAWRDWTVEERANMGEVRHASLRMLKLAQRFEQDFKNGRLLQDIAKNPEWVQRIPKGGDPTTPPEGFVYFKDIDAAAPGGTKKWGAIAGHWVREDVAHYLRANIETPQKLAWVKSATGTNLWKRFVTIYNPSYFVNNAMINVPTLELAGGSAFDVPLAARDFIDNTDLVKQLDARGTLNGGQIARDLAMQLEAVHAKTPEAATAGPMELAAALSSAAKRVEGGLGAVAQGTDDVFRLALVKRLMKPEAEGGKGMTLDEAADVAEASFYDPTRVTAPAAQYMEAFGFPFIKVLFYQLDRMPQLVLENPAKAATLAGYFVTLEAVLNAASGVDGDQAEGRRELMPEHMRPTGNHLNLPGKDAYGNPRVWDTKNFNPIAFAETTDRTAIPGLPAALAPGGPLGVAGALAVNYDGFRRKQIRDPEEDMGTQFGQVGGYIRDNALPTGIFNKVGKVVDAAQGRADSSGRRYDMATAMMNLLGVKVQPLDLGLAYDKLEARYEAKLKAIDSQIRAVERSMEANPQDAAKLEAEIQRLERRSERMEDERDRAMDRAEKAFPITTPAPAGVSP